MTEMQKPATAQATSSQQKIPVTSKNKYNTTNAIPSWADMDNILGPIEWAWEGWLPKGMLTILASESGIGKSALALHICLAFLNGVKWPDGTPYMGDTGMVLWCEAEAAQAINLERAKDWGLPIENIFAPLGYPLDDVRLDDPKHKEAVKAAVLRDDVLFVVVDSLRSATGGDENSSEFIKVVKWLSELARDSGKPILLIHHLRKPNFMDNGNGPNLSMLRGSSAIVQPARVVWALDSPDPNNKDAKRLQVIKSNLARFPEPIGMSVNGQGVMFSTSPNTPKKRTVVDDACDLLTSLLSNGREWAQMIESEFDSAGLSWDSAKRAKKGLGILSKKDGDRWYWYFPAKEPNEQF